MNKVQFFTLDIEHGHITFTLSTNKPLLTKQNRLIETRVLRVRRHAVFLSLLWRI